MNENLASRRCTPCEGGVEPLRRDQSRKLLEALHGDWVMSGNGKAIHRTFRFPTYGRSVGFANAVAWIAMVEGHHPDLTLGYDYCRVEYSTHAIDGLSDNDFICAAKVDQLTAGLDQQTG